MIIRFVLYQQYSYSSRKILRFELLKKFKPLVGVFYSDLVRANADERHTLKTILILSEIPLKHENYGEGVAS